MCILVLADDMTGALEVGAKFSSAGVHAIISTQPVPAGPAPVLVLDTETRHVDSKTAFDQVIRFVSEYGTERPRLIYKKTDSTLRGNIKAELQALAQVFPDWRMGYAGAYPALGRTVRAGVLYIHGVEVSKTEFARDELNPVYGSSISALLDPATPCLVFDGETDGHLADAARAIVSDETMRIAVGPAGLAEYIAAAMDLPKGEPLQCPPVCTCLILNGSRHERSAQQVRSLAAFDWQVIDTVHGPSVSATEAAKDNATALVRQAALELPDALFIIGGDTAFAVVRELGFPALRAIEEPVPGVAVSRILAEDLQKALPARRRALILITKAGGFGEDDTLVRVYKQLREQAC